MKLKQTFVALRYLVSMGAVSLAFALVCFAQQTAGTQNQGGQRASQPGPAKDWPADRLGGMIGEWTRAKNWTKEYIDKMPEDALSFKPTPEVRTFAEQMLHLAGGNFGYGATLSGQPAPVKRADLTPDKFKTKAELSKVVLDSYDFLIAALKGMSDEKLNERLPSRGTNFTRAAQVNNAFEHQTHHRGQTTIYLRMKGVVPPPEPF
ncbi:MAG: DinB family protein [Acidobacteria bacterium]|nr:DinB family protein [Acidobacteriota bacterium]MCI0665118.1 DinB family protein [Acidobacteriota bacterium]